MSAILAMCAATLVLLILAVALMIVLLRRTGSPDSSLREELARSRAETAAQARDLRQELSAGQRQAAETLVGTLAKIGDSQVVHLKQVAEATERLREDARRSAEELRGKIEEQLRHLQESNERKLEQMRQVVDEKLQSTLERRLGESFRIVGERLEAVQRGLGEMQALAHGVGDLKRVLTNVKARGTWGEVRLEAILSEILTPDQYAANVAPVPGSKKTVEFAVKLPGRDRDKGSCVWLPIDSKFPKEEYERLQEAAEASNATAMETASRNLARQVKDHARDIREKYIMPPNTTDFAIMFLPTEGLYAEVLRQPGLHEELHRTYRVLPAGPTVLAAMLNSLRMGFQTLAIEKRSAEVWQILAGVKAEMERLDEMLKILKKHLDSASSALDRTTDRTRQLGRKLRSLEAMPLPDAEKLLEVGEEASEKTQDGQEQSAGT